MIQVEIEAKFSIPDQQTFDRLLSTKTLAGLTAGEQSTKQVADNYGDTQDWAVLTAGYACRVREIEGQKTLTLKAFGHGAGTVKYREEREIQLEPGSAGWNVDRWPAGSIKEFVKKAIGDQALETQLTLSQSRHVRILQDGERPVAELSLDRVMLPESEPILELEVELLPAGTAAELDRTARVLINEWRLKPATLSKFERALQMRKGGRSRFTVLLPQGKVAGVDQEVAVPSDAPEIQADDPMSEAGRKVLRLHFERMLAHEAGTRLGEDIEELHDMRVATRRMRAAVRVFGSFFTPKAIKPHLKGLKRTGRALGPVRDLDVFEENARLYLATLPPERAEELNSLLATWGTERQAARERMRAYLDSKHYARFVERFGRFLRTRNAGSRPTPVGQPIPYQVQHIAPRLLYTRFEAVRAYEPLLDSAPIELLHALRIDFKQLRYALEFFRPVLGQEAKTVIQEIKTMQDHLGDLNDADVAVHLLSGFLQTSLQKEEGLLAYLHDRERERARLLDTFPAAWEHYNRPKVSRNLALAVAAL